MRQRDAQARCPDLVLVRADPVRDVWAFEPVLAVVEGVGVTVLRPEAGGFADSGGWWRVNRRRVSCWTATCGAGSDCRR
jgi:protein ImuB